MIFFKHTFLSKYSKQIFFLFVFFLALTIQSQSKISTFTFDGGGIEKVHVNPAGSYIGQTSSGTFVGWGNSGSGGALTSGAGLNVESKLLAELDAGSFVKQVEKTQGAFAVLFSSGKVITWG